VKWFGQCPNCSACNTAVEFSPGPEGEARGPASAPPAPVRLEELCAQQEVRLSTGLAEFDRALGGGLVPGSVVLLAGEPGVGKSTLLLQAAEHLSRQGPVLYLSGEESARQIAARYRRLGLSSPQVMVLTETQVAAIAEGLQRCAYVGVIVDSIQSVYEPAVPAAPGSLLQVRNCALRLARLAKEKETCLLLVGHITKEGSAAGPKALEHLVDVVLYFEGERTFAYRLLRAAKNRFGPSDEIGIFEMSAEGLKEVTNPAAFVHPAGESLPAGSCPTALLEGSRPLLLEVQALISSSPWGTPRRLFTGVDPNRAAMVLAVLEQRAGLQLGNSDVFVNLAGGLRVQESGLDLALGVALESSRRSLPVAAGTVVWGEIGLGGEVRPVRQSERRLREAARLGFRNFIIPAAGAPQGYQGATIHPVRFLEQALRAAFHFAGKGEASYQC